ncbi:MAG: Uma2 family endonuclease [Actinophytocola sp.]|uniref:Uma2 family endonuclease n=1 Tax=Actinophytocola sp. TaxID=1872138 RepID=UPI0013295CD0|nr:Uma2 family endonuclease [Actinophytocola sp.]MPZ81506.1 Uma2 family endonuclease [Actinophytocola sp.]
MSIAFEHAIGPTTVDDWLAHENPPDGSRVELILGYLHMNPPPTGQHQYMGDELRQVLRHAIRDGERADLYAVTGVGVQISTSLRTALIPDVSVLNTRPAGTSFPRENLVLAVEIWSPGNSRAERDTKAAAYASADVPYFWVVDQDRIGGLRVVSHVLDNGRYVEDVVATPGKMTTIKAAPVPVTFDPADLLP